MSLTLLLDKVRLSCLFWLRIYCPVIFTSFIRLAQGFVNLHKIKNGGFQSLKIISLSLVLCIQLWIINNINWINGWYFSANLATKTNKHQILANMKLYHIHHLIFLSLSSFFISFFANYSQYIHLSYWPFVSPAAI